MNLEVYVLQGSKDRKKWGAVTFCGDQAEKWALYTKVGGLAALERCRTYNATKAEVDRDRRMYFRLVKVKLTTYMVGTVNI